MLRYDYHRPASLEEAWKLKAEIPASKWIAGGTDLMVQLRQRRVEAPSALISLRSVSELSAIETDDPIRIGAMVPVSDLGNNRVIRELFPALIASIDVFASDQIRNVATVGGNLCNASPAADTAPPLLVCEARVELRSAGAKRDLALADFLRGPGQTDLKPDEILTAIVVDRPAKGARQAFTKKGRTQMDVAVASLAVLLEMEGETCRRARLAAGAVGPLPMRLPETERLLEGERLTDELVLAASERAAREIRPIDDLRSTAEYRRRIVAVYVKRSVRACGGFCWSTTEASA
ncbi:MAG: xanthine dehydrogenase family protein subunit M [Myxococcota bacterium]